MNVNAKDANSDNSTYVFLIERNHNNNIMIITKCILEAEATRHLFSNNYLVDSQRRGEGDPQRTFTSGWLEDALRDREKRLANN